MGFETFDYVRDRTQKPADLKDDQFIADLFASSGHIKYPQGLDNHQSSIILMPFTEQTEGDKNSMYPKIRKIPLPNICLPLPDSLVCSSEQDNTAENLAVSIRDERRIGISGAGGSFAKTIAMSGIKKISTALGKATTGLNIAGTIASATRVGFTPSVELLWNGPKLRTWPMSFRFQPHNLGEDQTVVKLIQYLTWLQNGRYGTILTRWPQVLDIAIVGRDGKYSELNAAFNFTSCSLSAMAYDPAPDGKFLLSRGAVPTDSTLNLTFTEVRGLDKSSIEKEYRSPKVLTPMTRNVTSLSGSITSLAMLGRG